MSGNDLDIKPGLRDAHAYLVEAAPGGKDGKGAGKGYFARCGQSGGDADHVLLGDATVEETVGELLAKYFVIVE